MVQRNVIRDVAYAAGDEAGIAARRPAGATSTSYSSGHVISYNTVYNTGRSGILTSYSTRVQVLHNIVHHVGLQTTDLGAIYTYGTDGTGSEIAYNVCYDSKGGGFGTAGIYLDNGSHHFLVHHNLTFRVNLGLKLNPPSRYNRIYNNTFDATNYSVATSGSPAKCGSDVKALSTRSSIIQAWGSTGVPGPRIQQETFLISGRFAARNSGAGREDGGAYTCPTGSSPAFSSCCPPFNCFDGGAIAGPSWLVTVPHTATTCAPAPTAVRSVASDLPEATSACAHKFVEGINGIDLWRMSKEDTHACEPWLRLRGPYFDAPVGRPVGLCRRRCCGVRPGGVRGVPLSGSEAAVVPTRTRNPLRL